MIEIRELVITTVALAAMIIGPALSCTAAEDAPEKVALEFVIAAFFDKDAEKAVSYLADDVERGQQSGEEVVEGLRREIARGLPESIALRQVRFFDSTQVDEVSNTFKEQAQERIDWRRLEEKLENGTGCLFLFEAEVDEEKRQLVMLLVLRQIDREYKIVYEDDN